MIETGYGSHFQGTVLDMLINAGGVVQFVLITLLLFSVFSWAIILMKYRILRRAKRENADFLEFYRRSNKLSDVFTATKRFVYSPVAEIFKAGYTEQVNLSRQTRETQVEGSLLASGEVRGIDTIERTLNRVYSTELAKLESALGFLATTGSVSPFIGLFGTVWGIMDTFRGIGAKGTATLAVVAPGISEALIATAAGLAAAIPAVIFFNYFQHGIKAIATEMDSFAAEFLNLMERHYGKR